MWSGSAKVVRATEPRRVWQLANVMRCQVGTTDLVRIALGDALRIGTAHVVEVGQSDIVDVPRQPGEDLARP